MKYIILLGCFSLLSFCCYSQIIMDSANASILYEIKKDRLGKYIKRTFKDLHSGKIYEYEANPENFGYAVRNDVIKYLKKKQKKFNEQDLYGAWILKSISDFNGNNITDFRGYEINEMLEFNPPTTMFIKKPISQSITYTGCYYLNKKHGNITTQTTQELSEVLFPEKEGDKLPKRCIKEENNMVEDTLFLYTLDSDHLTLYMFTPADNKEEFEQTVFLNYIKVHY